MTHWELDSLQNRHDVNGPGSTGSLWQRVDRGALLRWVAVGVVGVLLGIFLLRAMSLTSPLPPLLIIAALVPFVAMIVGGFRKLLLAVVILDTSFQWGFHLNYNVAVGSMGGLGGLGISVTTASLIALYVLWFAEAMGDRKARETLRPRASLPLALYVGFVVLSIAVARDRALSANEAFLVVQTFLLYVYIASTVRTRQDVLFLTTMLVVGLAAESLVILATAALGPGFSLPGINTAPAVAGPAGQPSRAIGTLHSPNVAGGFLTLLLVPALALFLSKQAGPGRRMLGLAAHVLGGLALLATFSRGAWLAFIISMAILSVFAWRRRWLPHAVPVATVAGIAVLFVIFQEPILSRLGDAQAAEGRLPLLEFAVSMIRDNPLFGVGANNFSVAMTHYLTLEDLRGWLYVVHDKYLLVWSETGIFALLAFLAFLISTIRSGWRTFTAGRGIISVLALGFTAAVVGQMVHMTFDIFNDQPSVQGLWVVAAIISAMGNMGGERDGD